MHPSSNPHHHPYTLPSPHFSTQPPPPADLDATLSALKTLTSLSSQTLASLSQNYQIPLPQNDTLTPCPFNPHHRIPPESLFPHSLHCPTPLPISPAFSPPRPNVDYRWNGNSELCVSLDEDFAYRDCPGAVRLPVFDKSSSRVDLGIPGVLVDEFSGRGIEGFGMDRLRMLPSEVWELRNEVAGWADYPGRCSVSVVRAVLGGQFVSEGELKRWVIVNSTGYGVVIDDYVAGCVLVLFKLCFKAIMREACELLRDWEGSGSLLLECLVSVQLLSWFASRFSVLYGEVNGKFFALNMFKHVVLESASRWLLFDDEKDGTKLCDGVDVEAKEPSKTGINCTENNWGGEIIVAQVGAAVAALYKRSLLEEKIRALRAPCSLTKYERNAEHTYLTNKAEEERRTRTNYRNIIDHDGLPRHYSSNQDTNKRKTREELLAEERDYKRRRTSYRGKKVKRSTLQVMRDIIEEYMEEIKQAGGIGCFEKRTIEEGISHSEKHLEDVCMPGNASRYREEQHQGYDGRYEGFEDHVSRDYDQQRRSHGRSANWGGQSRNSVNNSTDRVHHHRSPERSRSCRKSHLHSNQRMELDEIEATRKRHDKTKRLSPRRSKYHDDRSLVSSSVRKGEKKLETVNGKQRNQHGNHHSDYVVHNAFPDRYDPSES